MQRDNGSFVVERLRKIIEKNEHSLAKFQNRLKRAQFIDRPNPRMVNAAGWYVDWYSDQLMILQNQLRELEQIYGEGVQFRTTEERDVRLIWRWSNEPALRQRLRTAPVTLQAFIDNWHRWLADEDTHPLSIDLPTGELIGFMRIACVGKAWEARRASLQFIIIRPDCRYRGYGPEAVRYAIDFAFESLGVETFELRVNADNDAALRCFEKSGLRCVDIESTFTGEADRYRMELRREAWEERDSTVGATTEESGVDVQVEEPSISPRLFVPLKDLISNGKV